ncbi:MAG: methyltransferase domain-containing protein [Zetaproteobacteria bacterium]|nr:MAG: methyltransferase domain-containing protein [Zetaproteobacteria bacterium]
MRTEGLLGADQQLNNPYNSQYEYYQAHNLCPTFGAFGDESDLAKHEVLRYNVFRRLTFPTTFFEGKRVIEFGPDTGENALVFARWGARLTLVEPNDAAHPYIQEYFSKYGLNAQIEQISGEDLLHHEPRQQYDVVDAEGFIYTIKPDRLWIKKFDECLVRHGFAIINYCELYGSFMELLHKAIYRTALANGSFGSGQDLAKRIFLPKWNNIRHTRPFDAWFVDVIESPFVRKAYCIDAVELMHNMYENGFVLHASYPHYKNALGIEWIKDEIVPELEMREAISFIKQSRLSYMLGHDCFVHREDREVCNSTTALLQITDELIDAWSPEACSEALQHLAVIQSATTREKMEGRGAAVLGMVQGVFDRMRDGDIEGLLLLCRNDETFIETWGAPCHYAIFQKS